MNAPLPLGGHSRVGATGLRDDSPAGTAGPVVVAGTMPGRPDVRYAFSGRAHGTMSATVGDGDAADNRRRFLAGQGLGDRPLSLMRQVHGCAVALVDESPLEEAGRSIPDADAQVTRATDAPLAVLVADCVPVLLAGGDAIAAVHAGRGGVELGVVGEAVAALVRHGATTVGSASAVIGPAIGPCCYEVPPAMAEAVGARTGVDGIVSRTTWGTPSLDLPAAVAVQLRRAGVATVVAAGPCTRCAPDAWFSHRATGTDAAAHPAGRQMGVIVREAA